MKQITAPSFSTPTVITRKYRNFRGLDYSSDESQIDDSRSPLAVNMTSDAGGWPQKRLGWRTLRQYIGRINGIYPFRKENDQIELIVHAGAAIYRDAETPVKLKDGLNDDYSTGFYMANKLYILTGKQYLVYDGASLKDVSSDAYTPTTSYGCKPTGGGTAYEKVNLLSKWRYNKFTADGTATEYQLDVTELDSGTTVTVKVDGETVSSSEFSVDYKAGKITFDTAPAKSATGLDNVEIKFAKTSKLKDSNETAESLILNCTICTTYGVSTEDRVFVTGNPKHPATEYYSGLGDPSYFPDINYIDVGSSDWPILNYLKFQGDLVIVKEHNAQEYTVWHQSGELVSGIAAFPLRPGVAGIGAVSKRGAQQLLDDAIFLTPRGVFARVNSITLTRMEQGVRCRSSRVNRDIVARNDLDQAVSIVWDGYFILCFPTGECFVADSNQGLSDGGYEWYYWTNIPARVFAQESGVLWFGTESGKLCRFNSDVTDAEGNIQMDAYNDDGQAIKWTWATKMDDFGNLGMYKNLTKRGCVIQFKTAVQSSVDIYLRTEKDFGVKIRSEALRQLDFEQLDVAKWTFNTLPNNIRSLKRKVKKFQQLQVILKGEEPNEAFGVLEIVLRATAGNPVK